MPAYHVTSAWSSNIAIAVGDMIQNQSDTVVRIRAAAQSADLAFLELNEGQVYKFETATNIQVRTDPKLTGSVAVIRGL